MPRISDAAIQRDRESSLARYHRNKGHARKVQKAYRDHQFDKRPFIGWDGEGYSRWELNDNPSCLLDGEQHHYYMLFGASTGDCITGPDLSTVECLELILQVERENPTAYHVGFAFEYDVNMILRSLPWRTLAILKETGRCRLADPRTNKVYHIEHVPHKWFRVGCAGVSATIYDAFGFFHSKYLVALEKYGIGSEPQRANIEHGKALRDRFTYEDIEMVKAYWLDEISLLPALLDSIRKAAYDGGYRISEWHGPGALAAFLLRDVGASKWHSKANVPAEVKSAIRYAYAGGRFTGSLCGLYLGDVYTADLNSAYIYACSLLPRMDTGKWSRQNPKSVDPRNLADFGLYRIEFDIGEEGESKCRKSGIPEPPYPLFHRDKNGVLRWPRKGVGWYWTPEAKLVLDSTYARVLEAWVFNGDESRPFRFVNDAYNRRLELQHQGNPAEKAYKWALAAMYGAFARRVGWNRTTKKPPPSHELAWAGFITSWCRAQVWAVAFMAYAKNPGRGLISIDTDGVTATVPFSEDDLPNGVGENLGEWKLEHYTGILQWQNGIYWLRNEDGEWIDPKSRGIPKGTIPFAAAMDALQKADYTKRPFTHPYLSLSRTRFIGYGQAIRGQRDKWRKWVREPVKVLMGGTPAGKSFHFYAFCNACRAIERGIKYADNDVKGMHTITTTPPRHRDSYPHKLPWLEDQPDLPPGFVADSFNLIVKDMDME